MSQWRRRHGAPDVSDGVLDVVAGNGLINRRALLGRGMTIAGLVAVVIV